MDAERVVVELLAKVDNFDGTVTQSAVKFESSMDRIEKSATKAEQAITQSASKQATSLGQAGKSTEQFVRKIGEASSIVSGGTSPFVVIPKQAPQVASAMRLVETGAGLLGGVLGGALAAGALAAGAALLDLIFKSEDTAGAVDDLVQKLKENAEKADLAGRAQDIFANTLEGVTEALRLNEEALGKVNESNKTAARQALENALAAKARLASIRAETLALIEQARTRLEVANISSSLPGADPTVSALGISRGLANLDKMEKALKRVDEVAAKADKQINQALSFRVTERAQRDLTQIANDRFDAQIEGARKAATAEEVLNGTLTRQIRAIEAAREAELKRIRDTERAKSNADRQSGRQITEADARAIVAGIGGTVTSGTRTVQHNRDVGGVPGSFHVKGQALDIAKTAGMTLGKIVQAFEKAGVSLIEKLDEGDHFHVAWSRRSTGGRKGPSAETLAKRAEAARVAAERREQAFQNELADLSQQVLDARRALVSSAEGIAELDKQAIELERQQYNENLTALVSTKNLTQAEADQLKILNDQKAALRTQLIDQQEAARKRREALQIANQQFDNDEALLRIQEQEANTRAEHRRVALAMLDIEYDRQEANLRSQIAEAQIAGANEEYLQALRGRLDNLQTERDAGARNIEREHESPFEQYRRELTDLSANMDDQLEQIAVGGLDKLTDGLTQAILGFTSLKEVARAALAEIAAGLIKLAIQQLILQTIGKTLGAGATAATAAQAAAAATAWAPAAAAASLATLGANAGPAAAAIAATNALALAFAAPKGFARGGRIFGPGGPTSDAVPIMASSDEFMIKAGSARKVGYGALDYINRHGELPAYAGGGRIRTVSPMNLAAKSGQPRGGFSQDDIRQLRSIVSDAARAQPDVNLYASLDPADMLQRALGTPAGQRALIAALGTNAGQVKATLARP